MTKVAPALAMLMGYSKFPDGCPDCVTVAVKLLIVVLFLSVCAVTVMESTN